MTTKQSYLHELQLEYRHLPGYIWEALEGLSYKQLVCFADAIGGSILLGKLQAEGTKEAYSFLPYEQVFQKIQEERLRQ